MKKLLHIEKEGTIVATIVFEKKTELAFANAVLGLKKLGYSLKTSQVD